MNLPIVVFGLARGRVPHPDVEGPVDAAARPRRRGAVDRRADRAPLRRSSRRRQTAGRPDILGAFGFAAIVLARVLRGGSRTSTTRCSTCSSSRTRGSPPRASGITLHLLRDVRRRSSCSRSTSSSCWATRRWRPASALLPLALTMIVVAPLSARIVERIGTKLTVGTGLSLAGIGLALFTERAAENITLRGRPRLAVDDHGVRHGARRWRPRPSRSWARCRSPRPASARR